MSDAAPLLDGATLRKLQRLRLRDLDAIVRGLLGESAVDVGSGGRGVEFADYRAYAPGDDLRRIDWNVYARLRQPFVRTSPQERETGLALLLDGSRSMGSEGPARSAERRAASGSGGVALRAASGSDDSARRHAERLAALLGAVALLRGAPVQLTVLADGGAHDGEPLTGEQRVPALLDQLERLPRGRGTDLAAGLRARRPLAAGAEVAALITDALVPVSDLDAALAELARSDAATVLHVTERVGGTSSGERGEAGGVRRWGRPGRGRGTGRLSGAGGPVELVDAESGERLVLDLTPQVLAEHAAAVEAHAATVAARCRAHGVGCVRLEAGPDPFEQIAALADQQELVARGG